MTQESRKGPETRSRSLGVPICKMEMVLCSSFLQGTIVRMKICGPQLRAALYPEEYFGKPFFTWRGQ